MLSHVLRTITRQGLLAGNTDGRILCAVSGGPDSMAMLACLWELAPRLGLRLEIATVDHGLRPQAASEMDLVAARAADLGLPWHPLRVDVRAARHSGATGDQSGRPKPVRAGGGVQEVARRLRLAALAELADSRGCAAVALGHNADDQAETILFRIVRGTGLRGLAGIPYRRPPFIRPLLDVTRAQILVYLKRRSLPYATDPSNADPHYSRARVRHQILPLLRQENPRVDRALRSLGALAAAEFASPPSGGQAAPPVDGSANALVAGHVSLQVLAEIKAAAREGRGTRCFDVPGARRVTVSYGRVSINPDTSARARSAMGRSAAVPPIETDVTTIRGPGTHALAHGWTALVRGDADLQSDAAGDGLVWAWFDGDRLAWPLAVRSRRPGDRMRPRGGPGTRKLSDLLIDAKVPRFQRGSLPVVTTADGDLVFVPGLRPSETAAPSPHTKRRIGLAVVPKPDHDALVDRSIIKGNTGRRPYQNQGVGDREIPGVGGGGDRG